MRSEYSSSILKVFSGGSVAFIIGFIAMPIISRIYPPEEFGRFQLMYSIVTSFAIIASFRYEMAIVLEDTREDRDKLVTLCLILLVITSSIFAISFFAFGDILLNILNAKELAPYIGFMTLMFIGFGLYELSRYSFISEKKFTDLAINNIAYQGTTAGMQVGIGSFFPNFITLFISLLSGYLVAFGLALYKLRFKININYSEAKRLFIKHKKFFFFDSITGILSTFVLKIPIFFITKYHGVQFTGYFTMAIMIIEVPFGIFSAPISQVYLKEAKDKLHNAVNLYDLYKNTLKKLFAISIIPLIVVIVFADIIVNIFLGENWSEVAWILRVYIFAKIFNFINSPLSATFQILNKHEIPLYIVIFSVIIIPIFLFISRFNFNYLIYSYTIALILVYIIYFLIINKLLKDLSVVKI